jgi:hypothetical protein
MIFHRGRFERELDEELRLHLELRQQEIASGLPAEEARFAALRKFGNTARIKEKSHVAWGWDWLESLFQDVAYGLRAMSRSRALTTVALLSLALGPARWQVACEDTRDQEQERCGRES